MIMDTKESNLMPNLKKSVAATAIAIATVAAITTATTANAAESFRSNTVKNVWIQDVYTEIESVQPYESQECVMVRSGGGDAATGALFGMILGGLAGKGATGDDNGAAAGAVIGGIIGADRAANRGPGHLTEKCTDVTRYYSTIQTVYDYSVITFKYEGVEYSLTFIKQNFK